MKGISFNQQKNKVTLFAGKKVDATGDQIKQLGQAQKDTMQHVFSKYIKVEVKLFRKQSGLLGRGGEKGEAGAWEKSAQLRMYVCELSKNE